MNPRTTTAIFAGCCLATGSLAYVLDYRNAAIAAGAALIIAIVVWIMTTPRS